MEIETAIKARQLLSRLDTLRQIDERITDYPSAAWNFSTSAQTSNIEMPQELRYAFAEAVNKAIETVENKIKNLTDGE